MRGRPRTPLAWALALATTLLLTAPAAADPLAGPWLNFVYDPTLGVEAGVLSLHSFGDVVFLYDRGLSHAIKWTPTTTGGRILGATGRIVKSFFIDLSLAAVEEELIHEVFGHGARVRPWGANPSFSIHLPYPYRWIFQDHSTVNAETNAADFGQRERLLAFVAGGVESEYYSAYRIGLDAVRLDGRFPHSRQFLYVVAKVAYLPSFVHPLNASLDEVDDVGSYVVQIAERFNRWRPAERQSVADHVRDAYIANYIDPTLWLSIYGYLVEYIGRGRADWQLPMLKAGPISLYASTRFALSPFGAEHYLDLFARWRGRTFTLYGRAVSSELATAWGSGIRCLDLMRVGGLGLGMEIDAWEQPELLLDTRYINVFNRPQLGGLSLAADVDWKIAGRLGLTGKIGWKTEGWLMGEPLGEGPYGWIGLAYYADADGALFTWRP